MKHSDLCYSGAQALSQRLSKGDLSPVELVEAFLERLDTLNDTLKAFIHICRKEALTEARKAEAEIRSGSYRGPLHGMPLAYKDIYDVAGLPMTGGSKLLKGYVSKEDSAVAANLRRAGAVCIGKLNTWEFASGGMELIGDARNPWNTELVTGGSSSGSGAAVAAGLVPLATGTDTGGSVRDPAAFCGIVGLKPTFGRLDTRGIIPLSWSLDHPGPLARTIADAAMLFYGMAGEPMPDGLSSCFANPKGHLRGVRIGIPGNFFFEHSDPQVSGLIRAAVSHMQSLGASVQEIELPFVEYGPAASFTIAYTESLAFHRECFFKHAADYTPAFIGKISSAAFLNASDHLTSERIRQRVTRGFLDALSAVDIIVTPMTAFPPHPIGSPPPQSHVTSFARPVSLTGLPAMSIPCGFTSSDLPVNMQWIARADEEEKLFRTGFVYEQSAGWHIRRPPIDSGPVWTPPLPKHPAVKGIDAQWVLDTARQNGLTFVDGPMAEQIAVNVSSVKSVLAEAAERLRGFEPENLWERYL